MTPERKIFLGADIGATNTRVLLSDDGGGILGFGKAGPGNHESVGYPGLTAALRSASDQACAQAGVRIADVDAAGLGIGGLDWLSQETDTIQAIKNTGLVCTFRAVNDAILGLLAGTPEGWGVAVVSGTGCNCWGWNRSRSRIGHVTGGGTMMGEGAGATELTERAIKAVAHAWTLRGPSTALGPALADFAGARDVPDLLAGLMEKRLAVDPSAAPLIFQTALGGDPVAAGLIDWAGTELGEMANAVIRQLEFEKMEFDVVLSGSLFAGSPAMTGAMRRKVSELAPRARLVRLTAPPVVGAVLLAMEQTGGRPAGPVRDRLAREACARV
jgi:N-acetylglucosamine kinase-like BadF-type ATPase